MRWLDSRNAGLEGVALVALLSFGLALSGSAAIPAVDVASQPAYADGWDSGDDGAGGWLGKSA